MLKQNLLLARGELAQLYALTKGTEKSGRALMQKRCYAGSPAARFNAATAAATQSTPPAAAAAKQVSVAFALQEFLMHPLTWDRNNGFFNILLGLAIFGYCFCTSCQADAKNSTDKVSSDSDKKK